MNIETQATIEGLKLKSKECLFNSTSIEKSEIEELLSFITKQANELEKLVKERDALSKENEELKNTLCMNCKERFEKQIYTNCTDKNGNLIGNMYVCDVCGNAVG